MINIGSGGQREVKDYLLSRFACYLIAQNGDPRKKEIAEAQAYFAISTRKQELAQLLENQDERIKLRERVSENNKALAQAASQTDILSQNFGVFQNAGYKGLYGELGIADIKEHKRINQREDLLDRMGRAELAANDFRITQTEERLRKEGIIGQTNAMDVHHEVGKKVRKAIKDIGSSPYWMQRSGIGRNCPPSPFRMKQLLVHLPKTHYGSEVDRDYHQFSLNPQL